MHQGLLSGADRRSLGMSGFPLGTSSSWASFHSMPFQGEDR